MLRTQSNRRPAAKGTGLNQQLWTWRPGCWGPHALQDGLSEGRGGRVTAGAHSLAWSLPSYVVLGPLLSIMVPLSSFLVKRSITDRLQTVSGTVRAVSGTASLYIPLAARLGLWILKSAQWLHRFPCPPRLAWPSDQITDWAAWEHQQLPDPCTDSQESSCV